MKRREFIKAITGSAVAWPLAARAQPSTGKVGLLWPGAGPPVSPRMESFRAGLRRAGFVEGQNVRTEYRWAEGHYDRLPALAADLVSRHVSVIVPIGGTPAVAAAKTATSTTPIVFNIGSDPVKLRLVDSLNRPGGNLTGVAMLALELEAKRLELLRHVVPKSALIAVLVNPTNAQAEMQAREVQEAAGAVGQEIDAYRQTGVYTGRVLGRKTGRSADLAGNQVRVRHQSGDSQGAPPHDSADATRVRYRGDRVKPVTANPCASAPSAQRCGAPIRRVQRAHDAICGNRSSFKNSSRESFVCLRMSRTSLDGRSPGCTATVAQREGSSLCSKK